MTDTQMKIAAIKTEFPKHNKICYSLASRPEETGITFTKRALELAGEASAKKGVPNRKDQNRLSCWLPEIVRKTFDECKKHRGYKTDHDYIIAMIMADAQIIAKEKEKGAAHV